MTSDPSITKDLSAQLMHWEMAIERLGQLDDIASPEGWSRLERETNSVLRSSILKSIGVLKEKAGAVRRSVGRESSGMVARNIHEIRRDYLRTETMLDFFADAINSRSSEATGRTLRGLDHIAGEGMRRILEPLGYSTPPIITYIDKGLGASILKAGLRLWDRRSISPAASIKVVRHNILTATSILHELGHQVAHIVGWNKELANALSQGLPRDVSEVWASWASEIAADAIAFVYAGHASLSALRNVVDGGRRQVFRFIPGDPHPIGMARVLMVSQFAKTTMGSPVRDVSIAHRQDSEQPWLALERSWTKKYPLTGIDGTVRKIILQSMPVLPTIARITLTRQYKAFGNRALVDLVNPMHVSPSQLRRFEIEAGPRAFELPYVVRQEPIRLLALSGLRIATDSNRGREFYEKQQRALQVLGDVAVAA